MFHARMGVPWMEPKPLRAHYERASAVVLPPSQDGRNRRVGRAHRPAPSPRQIRRGFSHRDAERKVGEEGETECRKPVGIFLSSGLLASSLCVPASLRETQFLRSQGQESTVTRSGFVPSHSPDWHSRRDRACSAGRPVISHKTSRCRSGPRAGRRGSDSRSAPDRCPRTRCTDSRNRRPGRGRCCAGG